MSKRVKIKPRAPLTRADAEAAMQVLCAASAAHARDEARLNLALAAVRAHYEGDLAEHARLIAEQAALLEQWARENPGEFAKGAKSLELTHGRVGWRTGTPRLALLKGQRWDDVLGLVKSLLLGVFVRTKEELAKDEIIAAHARDEIDNDKLRELLRVEVRQDETFYCEPKLEEVAR
jgi:phage host-nuclease inhibitor protein Gam